MFNCLAMEMYLVKLETTEMYVNGVHFELNVKVMFSH